MAIKPKDIIKSWFEHGDKPDQDQFWDFIDSFWHKSELIAISAIDGLQALISGKANTEDLVDESQARTAADAALQNAIDNIEIVVDSTPTQGSNNPISSNALYLEQQSRISVDSTIAGAIEVERQSRTAADAALQSQINNIQAIDFKNKTTVMWSSYTTLPGTYQNGTGGVGATYSITASSWQAMDYAGMNGVVAVGDSFLLQTCSNAAHNGIYVLSSGGYNADSVFTRSINFDQVSEMWETLHIFVQNGDLNKNKHCGFLIASKVYIIGTSAITFSLFTRGMPMAAVAYTGEHASLNNKDAEQAYQHIDNTQQKTSLVDGDKIAIFDTITSKYISILWQNFRSVFVNITDIVVSSWQNGEQRLLLVKNNNGVPAFDGAAELLDIYAPPANAATLLVDSGWSNEQKTITGDNTLGQLGKVGQILWLNNKTFCQVISATYTSNASVTYYRNRCFDNLDPSTSTQDAAVLNALDPSYTYPAMTSTGNSTDLGWDLATQTKVLTVAARVGTWAVGGLNGEGYIYMCFKVYGSNTLWKRNGNPSFIQREITSSSHPNLVAALRAYDFTLGKYNQSGLETSYQDQTFSDDTNGYYYVKTDATKWSRFDALVSPRKTTITNAQLKALATTAVTVVSRPASGYINFIRGVALVFKAGTEALTVDATTTFIIRYVGGQTIATIAATAFIDSTTNKVRYTTQILISDSTSGIDNKAIEIVNTGAQISGNASNNATLDVLVNYTTVKI